MIIILSSKKFWIITAAILFATVLLLIGSPISISLKTKISELPTSESCLKSNQPGIYSKNLCCQEFYPLPRDSNFQCSDKARTVASKGNVNIEVLKIEENFNYNSKKKPYVNIQLAFTPGLTYEFYRRGDFKKFKKIKKSNSKKKKIKIIKKSKVVQEEWHLLGLITLLENKLLKFSPAGESEIYTFWDQDTEYLEFEDRFLRSGDIPPGHLAIGYSYRIIGRGSEGELLADSEDFPAGDVINSDQISDAYPGIPGVLHNSNVGSITSVGSPAPTGCSTSDPCQYCDSDGNVQTISCGAGEQCCAGTCYSTECKTCVAGVVEDLKCTGCGSYGNNRCSHGSCLNVDSCYKCDETSGDIVPDDCKECEISENQTMVPGLCSSGSCIVPTIEFEDIAAIREGRNLTEIIKITANPACKPEDVNIVESKPDEQSCASPGTPENRNGTTPVITKDKIDIVSEFKLEEVWSYSCRINPPLENICAKDNYNYPYKLKAKATFQGGIVADAVTSFKPYMQHGVYDATTNHPVIPNHQKANISGPYNRIYTSGNQYEYLPDTDPRFGSGSAWCYKITPTTVHVKIDCKTSIPSEDNSDNYQFYDLAVAEENRHCEQNNLPGARGGLVDLYTLERFKSYMTKGWFCKEALQNSPDAIADAKFRAYTKALTFYDRGIDNFTSDYNDWVNSGIEGSVVSLMRCILEHEAKQSVGYDKGYTYACAYGPCRDLYGDSAPPDMPEIPYGEFSQGDEF